MARYRKIDPRIWTDEKFRRLTADQQRIALYILTAQSNRIGLFSFSPGKATEDLEMSPKTFAEGFRKVCQTLKWEWDAGARVVYLPTWWKYNPPESFNNIVGNLKDLDDLPTTPLLDRFAANSLYLSGDVKQTFHQALAKRYPQPSPQPSPKPSPSQEQEQEQEQELEQEQDIWGDGRTEPPSDEDQHKYQAKQQPTVSPERLRELWNGIPGVAQANALTGHVLQSIRARMKEHPEEAWWRRLFEEEIKPSDFLCGRTGDGWTATLDWVCKPKNLAKILSGNYRNWQVIRLRRQPEPPRSTAGNIMRHFGLTKDSTDDSFREIYGGNNGMKGAEE